MTAVAPHCVAVPIKNDVDGLTHQEIAHVTGLTLARVDQLEDSGVRRIWRSQVNPDYCRAAGIPFWLAHHSRMPYRDPRFARLARGRI